MEVRPPVSVLPEALGLAVEDLPHWFVIGGQAVRCFCPYRPTRDVDFGVSSAENLEDLLTSTVFGLLAYVPESDGLLPFLNQARDCKGRRPLLRLAAETRAEYLFWPRWEEGVSCSISVDFGWELPISVLKCGWGWGFCRFWEWLFSIHFQKEHPKNSFLPRAPTRRLYGWPRRS